MEKRKIRRQLLRRLQKQPAALRLAKSLKIRQTLRRLKWYRQARILLCYVAVDGEVETRPILAQAIADGKQVAVPVTRLRGKRLIAVEILDPEKHLIRRGHFGIPEPARGHVSSRQVDPKELDLVLVPGVAFDRRGRRLGRGFGYFDRFLEKVPASVPRIGLGFRFQVVKQIPWEPHDQPVDCVITD